jgi:prepilin signal peptidase PulO-like enzyme (type II secretory pathway)
VACGVVGAVTFGLLPSRFPGDTLALAAFGAWFVTLIVGLATDLDQRVLPDELTLPVLPLALLYAWSGLNPRAVGGTLFGLLVAGLVLFVLLVTRRIGRKTYVPFGPFLIIGALWAVLIRAV